MGIDRSLKALEKAPNIKAVSPAVSLNGAFSFGANFAPAMVIGIDPVNEKKVISLERFMDCIPEDWNDGYGNVVVCCTIENQKNADYRLGIFSKLPIKHRCITAQPLLEPINIEPYLDNIELVVAGGESDRFARPLDYSWILDIREQCIRKNVSFEFRQCGTHFIKDGKQYKMQTKDLCSQARKAGIDYRAGLLE